MSDENKRIAESVRSGRYFEEARDWFQAVYIGPVSERTFFLIIAVLSAVVAVFALGSVFLMMPLSSKPAMITYAPVELDRVVPRLVHLNKERNSTNEAMTKFLVTNYVKSRESYNAKTIQKNALFVHAHSNDATYATYLPSVDPQNPSSFVRVFSESGIERAVEVQSMTVSEQDGKYLAKVNFTTELLGVEDNQKTKWTAKVEYNYTDITVTVVTDEDTGKPVMQATDPTFQVVNYVVEQK